MTGLPVRWVILAPIKRANWSPVVPGEEGTMNCNAALDAGNGGVVCEKPLAAPKSAKSAMRATSPGRSMLIVNANQTEILETWD